MPSKSNQDIEELLLEAHRKGIEQAIDLSIRTGVPLVVEEKASLKKSNHNTNIFECPFILKELS